MKTPHQHHPSRCWLDPFSNSRFFYQSNQRIRCLTDKYSLLSHKSLRGTNPRLLGWILWFLKCIYEDIKSSKFVLFDQNTYLHSNILLASRDDRTKISTTEPGTIIFICWVELSIYPKNSNVTSPYISLKFSVAKLQVMLQRIWNKWLIHQGFFPLMNDKFWFNQNTGITPEHNHKLPTETKLLSYTKFPLCNPTAGQPAN